MFEFISTLKNWIVNLLLAVYQRITTQTTERTPPVTGQDEISDSADEKPYSLDHTESKSDDEKETAKNKEETIPQVSEHENNIANGEIDLTEKNIYKPTNQQWKDNSTTSTGKVEADQQWNDNSTTSTGKKDACKQYEYFWKSDSPYSQWYLSEFTVDGVTFNCAEQFMMFKKAMLFKDEEIAYEVLQEEEPREQKQFGRKVRNFDPYVWEDNCLRIVKDGNRAKFSQNEKLREQFLQTYPKTFVEASPYDRIWGIGLEEDDPDAWDETTWRGQNLLGIALTKVRNELISQRKCRETEELGQDEQGRPFENENRSESQQTESGFKGNVSKVDESTETFTFKTAVDSTNVNGNTTEKTTGKSKSKRNKKKKRKGGSVNNKAISSQEQTKELPPTDSGLKEQSSGISNPSDDETCTKSNDDHCSEMLDEYEFESLKENIHAERQPLDLNSIDDNDSCTGGARKKTISSSSTDKSRIKSNKNKRGRKGGSFESEENKAQLQLAEQQPKGFELKGQHKDEISLGNNDNSTIENLIDNKSGSREENIINKAHPSDTNSKENDDRYTGGARKKTNIHTATEKRNKNKKEKKGGSFENDETVNMIPKKQLSKDSTHSHTSKKNDKPSNANKHNIDYLPNKTKEEAKTCYEFFWRSHSPYSQWYICSFTVDGTTFNCAEQYMMYRKAELFGDNEIAGYVLQEHNPREHKGLGRKVRNFDQKTWDKNCLEIVKHGNKAKFSQNEELLKIMLKTYPKTIVEASPQDKIWGIGLDENNRQAWNQETWRGRNLLGQALTAVRNELIYERECLESASKGTLDHETYTASGFTGEQALPFDEEKQTTDPKAEG